MKRHWCVIYGSMIIFFIACAIAIPNQSVPWVLTAIMTFTAMLWHRAQAASWQVFKATKRTAEFWRETAHDAMHECTLANKRVRAYAQNLESQEKAPEEEGDSELPTLYLIAPVDFPANTTRPASDIEEALAIFLQESGDYLNASVTKRIKDFKKERGRTK